MQLPESNISFSERMLRLRESIGAGCTRAELMTDLEVALSVANPVAVKIA